MFVSSTLFLFLFVDKNWSKRLLVSVFFPLLSATLSYFIFYVHYQLTNSGTYVQIGNLFSILILVDTSFGKDAVIIIFLFVVHYSLMSILLVHKTNTQESHYHMKSFPIKAYSSRCSQEKNMPGRVDCGSEPGYSKWVHKHDSGRHHAYT